MSAKKLLDRIVSQGTDSLSDVELLSLFLTARHGESAVFQATRVLDSTGLSALFLRNDFGRVVVEGLTERQIALLQAARVMATRASLSKVPHTDVLASPEHVRQYPRLHFQGRQDEVFGVLILDNLHRVLAYRDMFYGTVDSVAVYPRVVVKLALSLNCAACILVHSHPSGVAEPSDTDMRLTRKLVDVLALINVRCLEQRSVE